MILYIYGARHNLVISRKFVYMDHKVHLPTANESNYIRFNFLSLGIEILSLKIEILIINSCKHKLYTWSLDKSCRKFNYLLNSINFVTEQEEKYCCRKKKRYNVGAV